MNLQHAKANEVIFRQGERSRCMYRVQRGTVGIFLDYEKPDEKKLTELSVGQYFGEMGLLESWPRSATAVVLSEQADLQVIYEGDFALCFQENPAGMLALLEQMSRQLRRISRDYAEACRTVSELAEAEQAGRPRDAALNNRIAKTLAGFDAAGLDEGKGEARE